MLAIAHILDGATRTEAAAACGMERQTLRFDACVKRVHRYTAEGVAGLRDARRSGRPPALSDSQMAELRALTLAGPELATDGVVRWRCVDLRTAIKARFDVEVHERTVGKLLRRLELTRLQPRPYHPKQDAEAQAAFKKTSLAW
jgi:transposase